MERLEAAGLLDRAVAGLPDAAAMARRVGAAEALTRPEIAALLPFAKLWLTDAIGRQRADRGPGAAAAARRLFPAAAARGYGAASSSATGCAANCSRPSWPTRRRTGWAARGSRG
jgi:glutamate dehydrogenase